MKIVDMPRGGGKSDFLIRWASQKPLTRVIVTHDQNAAENLFRRANRILPKVAWRKDSFINIGSLHSFRGLSLDTEFAVDEVATILQSIIGNKIEIGTITSDGWDK